MDDIFTPQTEKFVVQCIIEHIEHKPTIEELVTLFISKGGRINEYYLRSNNASKQTLVYLNGWHSGVNIRDAVTKALKAFSV